MTTGALPIDLPGLIETVLNRLFGVAAGISPPVLVHPVLGLVNSALDHYWPRQADEPAPARQLSQRGLRQFLIGADEHSRALGKLTLLGLPTDPLQRAWSADGESIGEAELRIVGDGPAPPVSAAVITLTVAPVNDLWRLNPFSPDPALIIASAGLYADLMTAALTAQQDSAGFRTAAAGRPLEEVLAEGREHLDALAAAWLTAVTALIGLRAAQAAGAAGRDVAAELSAVVDTYNADRSAPAASPFLVYVNDGFLDGHPSCAPMPQDIGGGTYAEVLRAAILHAEAGFPVSEPGTGTAEAASGVPAPTGEAVLDRARELMATITTYTTDPLARWEEDKGDCSSFVQRALRAVSARSFDPGPDRGNAWTSLDFATRNDLFTTVSREQARPGDVLVQGGYRVIDGAVTWEGHCGLCTQAAQDGSGVLEGLSLDAVGPVARGLWGINGSYGYAGNLLVRRLRPRPAGGTAALPFADFSAAAPSVVAVNDAKVFQGFSLAKVHWRDDDTDADARPAIDAMGLGTRYKVRPGAGTSLLACSPGPLLCEPTGDGGLLVLAYPDESDFARLRQSLEVDNIRLVWQLDAALGARFAASMRVHHDAGRLAPVLLGGRDEPYERMLVSGPVPVGQDGAAQVDLWLRGEGAVAWRPAGGVPPEEFTLLDLRVGEQVTLYAEVLSCDEMQRTWYRVNAGLVLNLLRRDTSLQAEYDLLTDTFTEGGVASGGQAGSRGELLALWGGSMNTLVLQPTGVVPPALFSFATCDPIQVFAPALASPPDRPIGVRSCLPTIPRGPLTALWQRHAIKEWLKPPVAGEDFPAADYAGNVDGVLVKDKVPERGLAFYDALGRIVTYGPAGTRTGAFLHGGTARTITPQSDPASRPHHPAWKPAQVRQLKRTYPLRYVLKVGDAPEFAITQDDRDCIRQEYVFHLQFTADYHQTYATVWKTPERRQANLHPTTDPVDPHRLQRKDGRSSLPALGRGGVIVIPDRAELRPFDQGRETPGGRHNLAYHHTLLTSSAPDLVAQARDASQAYAENILTVFEAVLAGWTPPPTPRLPPYAVRVVTRIATLIGNPRPPTGTAEEFLYERLAGSDSRFAVRGKDGRLRLLPYGLTISSGWRPPEHNEVVSKTPASNHQRGAATDLTPSTGVNALSLLSLHLAAQDFKRDKRLSECLLENSRSEYVMDVIERDRVDMTILERTLPNGQYDYVLHSQAADLPISSSDEIYDGHGFDDDLGMRTRLITAYRQAWDKAGNTSNRQPWPEPTYLDMYIFGLTDATHVHHTWVLKP
ncbi:hypothetical protein ACWEPN_04060 [Nonomuraea wenchangensis]